MLPVQAIEGSATASSKELEFARLLSEEMQFQYRPCEAEVREAMTISPTGAEDQEEEHVPEGCEVMPDALFYSLVKHGGKVLSELKGDRFSYYSLSRLRWTSDLAEMTLKHWDKVDFRQPDEGPEVRSEAEDAYDGVVEEGDEVARKRLEEKVYDALRRFNRVMRSLVEKVEEEMNGRGQD
jgi:hypothetical protein